MGLSLPLSPEGKMGILKNPIFNGVRWHPRFTCRRSAPSHPTIVLLLLHPPPLPPHRESPFMSFDPCLPLLKLSILGQKMDSLHRFLSDFVDCRTPLSSDQLQVVFTEFTFSVHQTILNGATLLTSSQPSHPTFMTAIDPTAERLADQIVYSLDPVSLEGVGEDGDAAEEDGNIVEIDVEEHVHFCEICSKSFKRDANLRMHMRAHDNRFKTLEFLSKLLNRDGRGPDSSGGGRKMRFSCLRSKRGLIWGVI